MTPAFAVRTFIALLPDPAVREELAAWRDGWTWPRSATPVKTGRLHMTLHFLGDVAQDRIAELAEAARVPFTPFTLRFQDAVLWPHGIAVLEPAAVPDALLALHASLASALHGLGLAVDDRPFRPHVTLARRANGATPPGSGSTVVWPIASYALMSSATGADGAYTMLSRYEPLGRRQADVAGAVGPQHAARDASHCMHQVMVVPVDAHVNETKHVAEQHRRQR